MNGVESFPGGVKQTTDIMPRQQAQSRHREDGHPPFEVDEDFFRFRDKHEVDSVEFGSPKEIENSVGGKDQSHQNACDNIVRQ